jgi:SAM-dependent methyltransferase
MDRYQLRALHQFLELATKEGALDIVLEVGSDLAGAASKEIKIRGARMVVGINPLLELKHNEDFPQPYDRNYLLRSDSRWIPLKDESISSIFSVATFEHIYNLDVAMAEMYRVLRPGGILYSDFGPIWSCSVGHHVYAKVGEEEARHWIPGKNPVPHFGHLLYSPEELHERLNSKGSPALIKAIIDWIYKGHGINRLFYEDYLQTFEQSEFQIMKLNRVMEHVEASMEKLLRDIHNPHQEFGCRMIEVVLRKPN